MTMRIAILAACAGTLTLAAMTGAFAQSSNQRIPGSGFGTAQPSITDQGYAGPGNATASRGRISRSHKKSGTFLDGSASFGMRDVTVRPGDYDGDGRAKFRTKGRYSAATVRGIRMGRPGTSQAGKTTGEPIVIDGVVLSSGRRGSKISESNSPIPGNRRIITGGPHRR